MTFFQSCIVISSSRELSLIWLGTSYNKSNPAFLPYLQTLRHNFFIPFESRCVRKFEPTFSYYLILCHSHEYFLCGNFILELLFVKKFGALFFLVGRTLCSRHCKRSLLSWKLSELIVLFSFVRDSVLSANFRYTFFTAVVCGYRWRNSYFKDRQKVPQESVRVYQFAKRTLCSQLKNYHRIHFVISPHLSPTHEEALRLALCFLWRSLIMRPTIF
jgi:hypothetical protein